MLKALSHSYVCEHSRQLYCAWLLGPSPWWRGEWVATSDLRVLSLFLDTVGNPIYYLFIPRSLVFI